MAVLHIHIGESDSYVGKILPGRNLNLPDLHRGTEAFIGFADELLYYFVFEKKDGRAKCDEQNHHHQQEVNKNFFYDLQVKLCLKLK